MASLMSRGCIIWRDDKRVLRLGGIVLGDGLDALGVVRDLGHAPLLLQEADARCRLVPGKVFYDTKLFPSPCARQERRTSAGLVPLLGAEREKLHSLWFL